MGHINININNNNNKNYNMYSPGFPLRTRRVFGVTKTVDPTEIMIKPWPNGHPKMALFLEKTSDTTYRNLLGGSSH